VNAFHELVPWPACVRKSANTARTSACATLLLQTEVSAKLNVLSSHRFAVAVLICISIASSLWFLLDVITAYTYLRESNAFGVPNFDSRFEALHKNMPPRSVLGYVSDNPANDTQSQAEFYLTQYALAPAIVKATTEEHFVVANFHSNSPNAAMLKAKNLVLVQDFGNAVYIYRNTTR
jgi:hypothetical protein